MFTLHAEVFQIQFICLQVTQWHKEINPQANEANEKVGEGLLLPGWCF